MQITHQLLDSLTQKKGLYYLPDPVRIAIESCIDSEDEETVTAEYERLQQEFMKNTKVDAPMKIDYSRPITLDAYASYYFTRNFCIPLIGLRDLAYGTYFQNIPNRINVLDVGSGTGAVVFGLLWMFSNPPLSKIPISITALDSCKEALERQKCMQGIAKFKAGRLTYHVVDTCEPDSCIRAVENEGPFDLIFIANSLTEIPHANGLGLVKRLPEILTDEGAIVIAEAQRNYSKELIRTLIMNAPSWGLHVYYPCTGNNCPYIDSAYKKYCMVWRDHNYEDPGIRVKGSPLTIRANLELTACWLILTKQKVSIYDSFILDRLDLKWGPISKAYSDSKGSHLSICYGGREINLKDNLLFSEYRRGHIVGLSDDSEVKHHEKI